MERDQIESKLRGFIDQKLMNGQGADLTTSTPLFEFGILDSFALFRVISFIADEFQLTLPLESLRTEEFETIGTIAGLVHERIGTSVSGV
jgi:acyl carrier protein